MHVHGLDFKRYKRLYSGKLVPPLPWTLTIQLIFWMQPYQLLYIIPDIFYTCTHTYILFNILTYSNIICTLFSTPFISLNNTSWRSFCQ